MVRRPSGDFGSNSLKPEQSQIEPLDNYVDDANRIVVANPVFQAVRKQRDLPAIGALNEASHPDPSANCAGIIPRESPRPERFYTTKTLNGHSNANASIPFSPLKQFANLDHIQRRIDSKLEGGLHVHHESKPLQSLDRGVSDGRPAK